MKNLIKYLFAASVSLLLLSCDDEDGFYNEKYVDTTQFVFFDAPAEFNVGESLQVDAVINRLVDEPGFTDPLDIYETTGGAPAFTFSYAIEKQNANGEWEFFDVSNAVDAAQGSADSGFYVLAQATFVPASNTYLHSSSVQLMQPGQYRLSFGINSDSANEVEFRSESAGNNINLNLISEMPGLDSSGFYSFTVIP